MLGMVRGGSPGKVRGTKREDVVVIEVRRTRRSMLSAPRSKGRQQHSGSPSRSTVPGSGSIDGERIRILLSSSTQLPGSSKRPGKCPGQVSCGCGIGLGWEVGGGVSLMSGGGRGNEQHDHTPALGCACRAGLEWGVGVQGARSLLDWTILACKDTWLKEGDLPEHMGPWKSIEKVQQILRELGMNQAIRCL